jgi:phage-related tail fiber protein
MQIKLKQVEDLLSQLANRPTSDRLISAGTGLSGGGSLASDRTLSVAGLLLSLFNIGANGIITVSDFSANTISARSIVGASGRISVSNGDGISGNPTIDLSASGVNPGTYNKIIADTYGRITSASFETTLSGLGITNAVTKTGDTMTGILGFDSSIGLSQPTFTVRAAGTRLLLRDALASNMVDYALGVGDNSNMWFSIPRNLSTNYFNWYAGQSNIATLNGLGDLTLSGKLTATAKSFLIDHPTKENYQLQYASLEAPEYVVMVRGKSKGNKIKLPQHFIDLVDKKSITVHITPNSTDNIVFIDIQENIVNLQCKASTTYSYIVFGTRKDLAKLKVEIPKKP